MSDQDATDPGMKKLADGTIVIGNASQRAQLKRIADENAAILKEKQDAINAETDKPGDSEYIEAP